MTLPHLTSLAWEYATRRKGDVILDVRRVPWESMLEFEIFNIPDIFKFSIVVHIIAILSLIFDTSPSPSVRVCVHKYERVSERMCLCVSA